MTNEKSFNGLLLVDKPSGWTSHDVVAKVRVILKKEAGHKVKVGHTGTLDPLATGLMILVVGSYCKRAAEFSKLNKTYQVTMKLGETSTTGDAEGEIASSSSKVVAREELDKALEQFVGDIEQTPPAYSAIKVNGKKSYELARAGKEVKLEPRRVKIYKLTNVKYEYPFVSFTVEVSSGTYIRSLVEDIGKQLKTGAYMSALRRVTVGEFSVDRSSEPVEVSIDKIQ